MNKIIKNIIFDLDGTLVDSQAGIFNSTAHVIKTLGLENKIHFSKFKLYIGLSLADAFRNLLDTSDEVLVEEACNLYREYYLTKGMKEAIIFAEIENVLQELKSSEFNLYIATFKQESVARKMVAELNLKKYFINTYGPDSSGIYRTKSQILEKLILEEAINPDHSIMIGDHAQDIQAAKDNKFALAIGVAYGYGEEKELLAAGADFICKNPLDILKIKEIQ